MPPFLYRCFLSFDSTIMLWIRDFKTTHISVYSSLHAIDPLAKFLYCGAVATVSVFVITDRFLNRAARKILFAGIIVTGIAVQLKHLFGRVRPKFGYDTLFTGPSLKYAYSSFPSGHTTFIFMTASILSNYLPKYRVLFYGLATWVGVERIEDGAHFPSDVLAGAVLGLLIGRFLLFNLDKQKVMHDARQRG